MVDDRCARNEYKVLIVAKATVRGRVSLFVAPRFEPLVQVTLYVPRRQKDSC